MKLFKDTANIPLISLISLISLVPLTKGLLSLAEPLRPIDPVAQMPFLLGNQRANYQRFVISTVGWWHQISWWIRQDWYNNEQRAIATGNKRWAMSNLNSNIQRHCDHWNNHDHQQGSRARSQNLLVFSCQNEPSLWTTNITYRSTHQSWPVRQENMWSKCKMIIKLQGIIVAGI